MQNRNSKKRKLLGFGGNGGKEGTGHWLGTESVPEAAGFSAPEKSTAGVWRAVGSVFPAAAPWH